MVSNIIIAVVIMLVVLALTLFSISKGYAYKHTVDPMPENDEEVKKEDSGNEKISKRPQINAVFSYLMASI